MDNTHYIDDNANPNESNEVMWTNQIQMFNNEQYMNFLAQLEHLWGLHSNDDHISFRLGYDRFFNKSDLNPNTGLPDKIDIEAISGKHSRMKTQLGQMYHRAESLKLLDLEDGDDIKISTRINRLIDQVDDAWQIVFRNTRIHERINNPTYVPINPQSDPSIFRCSTITEIEELSPYQQAILQLLNSLYQNNIKRYKGQCCTQIKTDDGYDTRAWKPMQTIKEYVYSTAQKETEFELWKNLSSRGGAIRDTITYFHVF